MGPQRENAGLFVVLPQHIDMIRFIKQWIEEGSATFLDITGTPRRIPGKRYLRAMDKAISKSQLMVFTGETQTPLSNGVFDTLIAIILMGEHGLPVRPLMFVSSAWKDKISWEIVARAASNIRSAMMNADDNPVPCQPLVVELKPNTRGHRTLSATRGPGVVKLGGCWSFRDTLDVTLDDCMNIDKKY